MGKAQNTTRRLLPKSAHMIAFDLRAEARRLAPQALEVIEQALSSKDERTRLVAATIVLERGWGKPQVQVDAAVTHKFCIAPEVMEQSDWLRSRGQPEVLAQLKAACPDASTPDDIIDLKAESDDTKH
jgi:HEAT repeat protein